MPGQRRADVRGSAVDEKRLRPLLQLLGLRDLAAQEQIAREAHRQLSLQLGPVEPRAERHRPPPDRDRLGEPLRDVQLPAEVVEQARPRLGREPVGVHSGRFQVGEGLPVRPAVGGGAGRGRRELKHCGGVARGDGVVHELFRAGRAAFPQRRHHPRVQRAAAQRGQRGLDGAPGELVAER